jgi:hypothetical protein
LLSVKAKDIIGIYTACCKLYKPTSASLPRHTHTHTYACAHTETPIDINTHRQTYTDICTDRLMETHRHMDIQTHIDTLYVQIQRHVATHIYKYRHIAMQTCSYTQTPVISLSSSPTALPSFPLLWLWCLKCCSDKSSVFSLFLYHLSIYLSVYLSIYLSISECFA